MKRSDFQEVKNLMACVEVAERNIQTYEELKGADEIQIRDSRSNRPPTYVTGKRKNEMIDILIKEQQEFLSKKLIQLEGVGVSGLLRVTGCSECGSDAAEINESGQCYVCWEASVGRMP